MNSRFIIYLRAAVVTFLWLALIYTVLAFTYVLGLVQVPNAETRIFYFYRFWLSLPVALMMTVFVLPLVLLGKHLETKFNFPRILPVVAIFPISFAIHFISIAIPWLLIPILLVGAFIYPAVFQGGNWGLTETTISSINISVAFLLFWTRLEVLLNRHNNLVNVSH